MCHSSCRNMVLKVAFRSFGPTNFLLELFVQIVEELLSEHGVLIQCGHTLPRCVYALVIEVHLEAERLSCPCL